MSRTSSWRVNTQYPCAKVLKKAGPDSRSSSAHCQYLPASLGGAKSAWMTGQPPSSRSAGLTDSCVVSLTLPPSCQISCCLDDRPAASDLVEVAGRVGAALTPQDLEEEPADPPAVRPAPK